MAKQLVLRGIVQGVGFRPFVFRLAQEEAICGWVCNGATGVEIHAEGAEENLERFVSRLQAQAPPAAQIARLEVQPSAWQAYRDFQIVDSQQAPVPTARISPDLNLCADCRCELLDPADRRFQYPYINCTHCGPRYSIVLRLPYDRGATTMASWPLCERCRAEYENPANRRFHAQPVACAECGPNYRLENGGATLAQGMRAIEQAAALLRTGQIVAIKGIGGYHLACAAENAAAVAALRTRKFRKEKPFALLARDLAVASGLVEIGPAEQSLLESPARPIVLLWAKRELLGVAPDQDRLGIMLPSSPLHELLFAAGAPAALVLTSGNRSNEPIAYEDDDALRRLAGIADAFLVGERPIARRVDDSVAIVRQGRPALLRRARGYAPGAIVTLPATEPILALGSDLKNTIALVVEGQVFVSQHLGDLGEADANRAFAETVCDLMAMYRVSPDKVTVVHDLHPQFHSTRFAEQFRPSATHAVQHHVAHIASVLAETELLHERVLGVAFDGTGYGLDGTIWGGEFFAGDLTAGFNRIASIRSVKMPGGDAAARLPLQAAAGFLADGDALDQFGARRLESIGLAGRFTHALALVRRNVRCIESTSVGRLFDAVAAIAGFQREISFEGQAAMWLEHQARQVAPQAAYAFPRFDHRPLFAASLRDRLEGRSASEIASAFHAALAAATADAVQELAAQHGCATVALSGGVFQNELLCEQISALLETASLRIVFNSLVPANDGGIALGQAALMALRRRR
ncbi:MAG TPA: carbamoyltransferase HypF [Pirellulales bacterium]|nr:carbamoyltransferase HypF [Pirellulales bacterium]